MALISCPECGKEVSDRASSCIHCGCPLREEAIPVVAPAAEKVTLPKKNRRKQKKTVGKRSILIAAITVAILMAVAIIFLPQIKVKAAYIKARSLYDNGQYAQALTCIGSFDDDPECATLAEYCKYMIAQEAITQKDWSSAISALETITYGDSQDLLLNCYYSMAEESMAKAEWATAISILTGIDTEQSLEMVRECTYNLGIEAMEAFDWETAKGYFTDLGYEQSEKMLTDCSFMLTLEESVLRRMEINAKESFDNRSVVTTELAYLEEYRKAAFYDSTIGSLAKKYIGGLDKQLSGLTYEHYYEYQRDWNTGLVARYEALNALYENYDFMSDNKDFIGEYINQLSYYQKWLQAFKGLEKGITEIKMTQSYYYLEYQFKNNSPYSASYVFEFVFTSDEAGKNHFGTQTVSVANIGPYEEFTVRVTIPEAGRNGGFVDWTNYYSDIKVK